MFLLFFLILLIFINIYFIILDKSKILKWSFSVSILVFLFISLTRFYLEGFITKYDVFINNLFLNHRNIYLINIFSFITNFCSSFGIILSIILFSLFLIYKNKKQYLCSFISSCVLSSLSILILKNIYKRERPLLSVYLEDSFSFPSGHSVMAVALYGFIIYFIISQIKNIIIKRIVFIIGFIFILLIGLSRLYLGVHYFSDVIGGFLVGLIWLILSFVLMFRNNCKIK